MRKYQGMTLIGMLLTTVTVIIAALLVIKIMPVYLEHYEVVNSMKTLNTLPSTEFSADQEANANILKGKLLRQLDVNSIESIQPEQITITPEEDNKYDVSVKYQVIKPLVGNMNLLFKFQDSTEVKVSAPE